MDPWVQDEYFQVELALIKAGTFSICHTATQRANKLSVVGSAILLHRFSELVEIRGLVLVSTGISNENHADRERHVLIHL